MDTTIRRIVGGYSVSNGTVENIPRKWLLPRNTMESCVTVNTIPCPERLNYQCDKTIPVFDHLFHMSPAPKTEKNFRPHLEGEILSVRILESGKLSGLFFLMEERKLMLRIFCWNEGLFELETMWEFLLNPYKPETQPMGIGNEFKSYLPMKTVINAESTYCCMVNHFGCNENNEIKNKYQISIGRLRSPTDGIEGTLELHKDVFTIEFKEEKGALEFVLCLSPNKNLLAITSNFMAKNVSRTHVIKIDYKEKLNSYTATLVNEFKLHDTVCGIIFSEFEEKLIFLTGRRLFVVENSSPPYYEVFEGYTGSLLYDAATNAEYLSLRSDDELELIKMTGNQELQHEEEYDANGMGKLTYDIVKRWDIDDVIDEDYGRLMSFHTNSGFGCLRWFLGFQKFILVVDPFKFQHLFSVNLYNDPPLNFYTFEIDWSGKQMVTCCWQQNQFDGLKIFHIESLSEMSLKYQAVLVVLKTFSMVELREMNLPKHIRRLLGDHLIK